MMLGQLDNVKQKYKLTLAGVAQLVGVLSYALGDCGFDFQSGHLHRLLVQSLLGAHMGGHSSMYLSLP